MGMGMGVVSWKGDCAIPAPARVVMPIGRIVEKWLFPRSLLAAGGESNSLLSDIRESHALG
jgi:hypothetical protein